MVHANSCSQDRKTDNGQMGIGNSSFIQPWACSQGPQGRKQCNKRLILGKKGRKISTCAL